MFLAPVIILVVALSFGFLILMNKVEGERDERQKQVVDRAYKYAFVTIMFFNAVVYFLEAFGNIQLLSSEDLAALSIWLGTLVFAPYTIWQHAYFPVKVKKSSSMGWFFAGLGLLELLPVAWDYFESSKVDQQDIYLVFLGILLLITGGTILLRNYLDRKEDEGR